MVSELGGIFWGENSDSDPAPEASKNSDGKPWWKFWVDDGMPPENK